MSRWVPYLVLVVYILSYPFSVRVAMTFAETNVERSFSGALGVGYEPVYWLLDQTEVRRPLLALSRVLGVEKPVKLASRDRVFARSMLE